MDKDVTFEDCKMVDGLRGPFDLSVEQWREYSWLDEEYRIERPIALYIDDFTHRIVDAYGVTHCVPGPGSDRFAVVITWYSPNQFVSF